MVRVFGSVEIKNKVINQSRLPVLVNCPEVEDDENHNLLKGVGDDELKAYDSVCWWKIFTADQCSGITRFLGTSAFLFFIIPYISTTNPYAMNLQFIVVDTLQKIVILVVLGLWTKLTKTGSLDWLITLFFISTLPNTLIIGVPLLVPMYGELSRSLMIQVLFLQCIVWFTVLLFLFEFRAAKMLVREKLSDTAASIVSSKIDSDVFSLDNHDFLKTASEIGDDGMLDVTIKKSNSSGPMLGPRSLTAPRRKSNSSRPMLWTRSLSAPHRRITPTVNDDMEQSGRFDQEANEIRILVADDPRNGENKENFGEKDIDFDEGGSDGGYEKRKEEREKDELTCHFRVIRNPSIHSSVIGLVWSLITFRVIINEEVVNHTEEVIEEGIMAIEAGDSQETPKSEDKAPEDELKNLDVEFVTVIHATVAPAGASCCELIFDMGCVGSKPNLCPLSAMAEIL
ncbi:Peptidyl-prolyl cis-trans isomerase pin4 [Sarracenia purpurea var. burkii]